MSDHSIVHIELSAADLKETGQFYKDLFGWKIDHDPEMNYVMWQPGSGPGGGFSSVSETNPAGTVMIYIGVDDIEATLAKVEALGGKTLVPKTEIPGMGWFGVFTDPTGNNVGVFSSMAEA